MRTNIVLTLLIYIILIINKAFAESPSNIGNFSLNSSQQPGPFFSFGQNIIDKNQLIVFLNSSYNQSPKIIEGSPSAVYGITDSASILLTQPYAFLYKNGSDNLSGFGDLVLDFEYAYYTSETSKYSDTATVVFSPTFPISNLKEISKEIDASSQTSGFARKNTPSNFATFTYFLGTTYSRTFVDWYAFVAPGILIMQKDNLIQQGKQYYYNFGIGRNLKYLEKKYTLFGLLEFNGQYSSKTKLASISLPDTGGNIIYATPSLSFATQKLVWQVGISLPIFQFWNGNQSNISYNVATVLSWTIN